MSGKKATDRIGGSKNREVAREKARLQREQQKRTATRKRAILISSQTIALVAVVAGLVLIIVSSIKPAGDGPQNMASDGIVIGQNHVAQVTPGLKKGELPTPSQATPGVADIRIYFDYICPFCGQFERANTHQLEYWMSSGVATVEYHPLTLFDRASSGTKYSTRSANAAACVANYSPNQFWGFNSLLFTNQPQETSEGLDDATLKEFAAEAGVAEQGQIEICIDEGTFARWSADATARAMKDTLPGTDQELTGTPLVIVNGHVYKGAPSDAVAFEAFVNQYLVK